MRPGLEALRDLAAQGHIEAVLAHSPGRELTRLETSMERLLTAYQESLLTLAELRRRMPELRKQQQAMQSELTSMELAASDQSRYLRLTHTLTEFRERLHAKSETMEIPERQKILRLLVKERRRTSASTGWPRAARPLPERKR